MTDSSYTTSSFGNFIQAHYKGVFALFLGIVVVYIMSTIIFAQSATKTNCLELGGVWNSSQHECILSSPDEAAQE